MTSVTNSRGSVGPYAVEPGIWWEPVKAFAVFLAIQIALVVGGVTPFHDGMLADPDAYMRMNRVLHLWGEGTWFDPVYPRISPPDGLVQHWTRPMDILLLAGALIAAPFAGFEAGLHWWGVMVGPVLQLPALLALVWAAVPLVRRDRLWLVGVLFVTQPAVLMTFLVGRPDHNALLILLFVLTIGLTIRMLLEPDRLRLPVLAGIVSAVALWVSIESLTFVVPAMAVVGLYWVLGDSRLARTMLVHSAAVLATLVAALLIERGVGRFAVVEFDEISLAHIHLFGLTVLFWVAAHFVPLRLAATASLPGKSVLAGLAAAAVLVVLWLVQPGFFASPFDAVDELYRTVRLVNIAEFQPIVRWSSLNWADAPSSIGAAFLWLGSGIVAIPCLAWMIWRHPKPERRGWIMLAAISAVFVPLAFSQVRWTAYAETTLVISHAVAVGAGLVWINGWKWQAAWLALPRALLVAFACTLNFVPALFVAATIGNDESEAGDGPAEMAGDESAADDSVCPLAPLSRFLADPTGLGAQPKRIMAFVDFGPEILYRTSHSVFAIPNHRYQSGFTATHQVMTAGSAEQARAVLRRHDVELIVICPEWPLEASFYGSDGGTDMFYGQLASGVVPSFLAPLALPEHLTGRFVVFALDRP